MAPTVPAAVSSFIGRADEVATLASRLTTQRLVTLVGPGGTGKTRLAREVAEQRAAAGVAVRWVELAPLRSGTEVGEALAAVLGVTAGAGRELTDALVDAIRGCGYLLVLDNCEHVIEATAALVETLLRCVNDVAVLATSREPLALEGELAWMVPPLELPPPADPARPTRAVDVADYDAVRLFADRARAATPRFALSDANAATVAAICARLDGLPLAIELAAAMLPVLGVDTLAARLDDAFAVLVRGRRGIGERHRTLRAVLDWSYELLQDDERLLLQRLSVFRGAVPLEAIESVCGDSAPADVRQGAVVATLGRLVEQSLVEVQDDEGQARYRLLETVRQYAEQRLRDSSLAPSVRRRHAEWVAREAEAALPLFYSPARGAAVHRLRGALDEIRAALSWATGDDGDALLAVRITGALGWFWISGISWEEGSALVERTLAAAEAAGIPEAERPVDERIAYGTCIYPRVGLAYFAGDVARMLELTARELAFWDAVQATPSLTATQQLTIARGQSLACQLRSLALAISGSADEARVMGDRCVHTAERSGDRWLHAVMLIRRALMHLYLGDHGAAARDYATGNPLLRAQGEAWFLSLGLEGMAMNALAMGDPLQAASYALESIEVLREERDAWFISRSLDALACIVASPQAADSALGSAEATALAIGWMGTAETLRLRCGAGIIAPDVARNERAREILRDRCGEAAFTSLLAEGRERSLDALYERLPAATEQLALASPTGSTATPEPSAHPSNTLLEIDVLGPFAMRRNGEASTVVPTGKSREILLYLLLHEDASKDAIGLAIWPEASAAQVKNLFHVGLHGLRQQLGPERWIVFERGRYRIDRSPAPGARLVADVHLVVDASARLRNALRRRERWDDAALDAARQHLARARGVLAEHSSAGDWIVAEQDRVHAAWTDGMEALAQLLRARERFADAVAVLDALLAREAYRESAHRSLMESLAALGERARALKHYDQFVAFLKRELGTAPSQDTRTVAERIARA